MMGIAKGSGGRMGMWGFRITGPMFLLPEFINPGYSAFSGGRDARTGCAEDSVWMLAHWNWLGLVGSAPQTSSAVARILAGWEAMSVGRDIGGHYLYRRQIKMGA